MTSSINDKIKEEIREKKILEKQKHENAEKLLQEVEVFEPEVVEEEPKPKAKAKKSVKKNATKKG